MQKVFYVTATVIAIGIGTATAQTKKGSFVIGTTFGNAGSFSAGISPANNYTDRFFRINLQPSVGYFIKDNWEIGTHFNVGFSKGRSKYINELSSSSTNLGIGFYSRYYFGKSATVRPYIIGGIGYDRYWNRFTESGSTTRYTSNNAYAYGGAGLSWFIRPGVAFTAEARYYRHLERYPNGQLAGNFGFQVFFGGKRK
jgi:outer membrane protein W